MPNESYGDTVAALDKLAQEADSDKQEAQITRLKNAARKTLIDLKEVHAQMKSALTAKEDAPDTHHELAERASMLRNKLYYLNDVGKEISKGNFEEFKAPPVDPLNTSRTQDDDRPAPSTGVKPIAGPKGAIRKEQYGY